MASLRGAKVEENPVWHVRVTLRPARGENSSNWVNLHHQRWTRKSSGKRNFFTRLAFVGRGRTWIWRRAMCALVACQRCAFLLAFCSKARVGGMELPSLLGFEIIFYNFYVLQGDFIFTYRRATLSIFRWIKFCDDESRCRRAISPSFVGWQRGLRVWGGKRGDCIFSH